MASSENEGLRERLEALARFDAWASAHPTLDVDVTVLVPPDASALMENHEIAARWRQWKAEATKP